MQVIPAVCIFLLCITQDTMSYIKPEGESKLHIFLVIFYIMLLYILIVFTAFYCLRKNVDFKGNMRLIQLYYILIELKIAVQYYEANGDTEFYGPFKSNFALLSMINFIFSVNYNCSQILFWQVHSVKLLIFAAAVGIRYDTDIKIVVYSAMTIIVKTIVMFS